MQNRQFIVIYDTYCGWCYGAAPMFDALVASGAEVEVLHRHLFQGPLSYRLTSDKSERIQQADARIAAMSGQEFSQTYFDNIIRPGTEVLASHFTAQAAALVHDQGPEKEFALRQRLQKARFVDGISASDRQAVVEALVAEGVTRQDAEKIGTPELAAKAEVISKRAAALMDAVGSNGVPTILEVTDGRVSVVDHHAFYAHPEGIARTAA